MAIHNKYLEKLRLSTRKFSKLRVSILQANEYIYFYLDIILKTYHILFNKAFIYLLERDIAYRQHLNPYDKPVNILHQNY